MCATHGDTLQHTATHCDAGVLDKTIDCDVCNTLRNTATHYSTLNTCALEETIACDVYYTLATHCNTATLQITETHCNTGALEETIECEVYYTT